MHPSLRRLLTEIVLIKRFTGLDSYGEEAFDAPAVPYACRIVGKQQIVKSETGVEVLSTHTIYLASAPGITTQDRITLPGGETPEILSVASTPDQHGVSYETLMTE